MTAREAKPLVAKGLVEPTDRLPENFQGRNIGNSKRWYLTDAGKEIAERIRYNGREYSILPQEDAHTRAW